MRGMTTLLLILFLVGLGLFYIGITGRTEEVFKAITK